MADIIGAMYIYLDIAKVGDFATDNGQMLNLADTFVSSLQNDLQALQNAIAASDTPALQRLLHTLKGYVTFLCNDALSRRLIDLEAHARQMTQEQLSPLIDELFPALTDMQTELNDWRQRLSQEA